MRLNSTINNGPDQSARADEVLKLTALVYFEDALTAQRYEDCPELIRAAKSFGATQADIRAVINGYVGGIKTGRGKEPAKPALKGRRRF